MTEHWSDHLYEGDVWVGADGVGVPVEDMTGRHAANAYHFALRQASEVLTRIQWSMAMGPQPSGDVASDGFDNALEELYGYTEDPEAWIVRTPLLVALARQGGLPAVVDDDEDTEEISSAPEPVFYDRRPQRVAAVRFDSTNTDALSDLVGPFVEVTGTLVSGPGPCRGMQQAVRLKGMSQEATVPVGSWLLVEEDQFWCLSDSQFRKEYNPRAVDAVILCFCGEDSSQGSHLMCYPGMD